ncbi:GNAT family N-acetyltransferase [Longimicrobium sp.]|uniref:GNAT family N-acetyltransferase n=1 Tax=Longimicrobium sp. TaxID=2029185 RepID=UPI002E2F193C|nr:GNAT family N-acetyltransferase [Longimicrobium sp.]HEX6042171.1 GNAT family N-acetyltransferase [Longimicrobium sp.]
MSFPPTLTTTRLLLRPFTADDAPAVQAHLAERAVADTTAMIPHPYPEGGAAAWIATHEPRHDAGEAAVLAITLREDNALIGSIELRIDMSHLRGELGYWIGRPHWGMGYATEAADALLRWGIRVLGLHRVHAAHLSRNPASGAVLRKIGMRHEGSLRGHVRKWDVMEDLEVWGLLEDELPRLA